MQDYRGGGNEKKKETGEKEGFLKKGLGDRSWNYQVSVQQTVPNNKSNATTWQLHVLGNYLTSKNNLLSYTICPLVEAIKKNHIPLL